jgi:hypothetical protein
MYRQTTARKYSPSLLQQEWELRRRHVLQHVGRENQIEAASCSGNILSIISLDGEVLAARDYIDRRYSITPSCNDTRLVPTASAKLQNSGVRREQGPDQFDLGQPEVAEQLMRRNMHAGHSGRRGFELSIECEPR